MARLTVDELRQELMKFKPFDFVEVYEEVTSGVVIWDSRSDKEVGFIEVPRRDATWLRKHTS